MEVRVFVGKAGLFCERKRNLYGSTFLRNLSLFFLQKKESVLLYRCEKSVIHFISTNNVPLQFLFSFLEQKKHEQITKKGGHWSIPENINT